MRLTEDESVQRQNVLGGPAGLQYVSYQKKFKNLRVVGGDSVVVARPDGTVTDVQVANTNPINVDTAPKVSALQALGTARGQVGTVDGATAPELVVYALEGKQALAWESVVTGTKGADPTKLHVWVDAVSGQVLGTEDEVKAGEGKGNNEGTVTIETTNSGGQYSMVDATRKGLSCGPVNGQPYKKATDTWGNGSGTDLETACVDAYYSGQREISMLKEWFGRDGVNGKGQNYPAYVNLNAVNAYWNGSNAQFGHNQPGTKQLTSMDVVGHEFGHGIFQFSGSGGGGGGEAGGMNESTGDIFGALTEHYANNAVDTPDFLVGEQVDIYGNGKPLRNMYDPKSDGKSPNCWSSTIGNLDVHYSAGPQNLWFYALSEGSNPAGKPAAAFCSAGTQFAGIGVKKAGQLFLAGLQRKTSSWNYANGRKAMLQAAKDTFPGSCEEFNAAKAAFDAIKVPAQSGEATCALGGAAAAPDISVDNVKAHLTTLQSGASGGNRLSGSAGHKATVDYIEGKLKAAGWTTARQDCTTCRAGSQNLIADFPGGDENNVLMLGAHSDSVQAGPGINDNGSGSASILEVALNVAQTKPNLSRHLRFAWWAGEEQGLIGSTFYVNKLAAADKAKIKDYLNFDMVGSPNGGYFINNITTPSAQAFVEYYKSIGVAAEENTEGANRSDDASFRRGGVATSGIAAGASYKKTAAQAQKWGGTANGAYDACYHSACDTTTNINNTILDRSADAIAYAIWKMAVTS
ncbi:M28 family peptidase [Pseudonocardiaceae bacterium YIM PH 21723]|nr:M28 family peptidase [Pseudonocardiaceae bacterium YIM PH 21723]